MKCICKYLCVLLVAGLCTECTYENAAVSTNASTYLNEEIDFTGEEFSEQEYGNWVQTPGNGCIKVKTIGDITFKLFHKPIDYIICSENDFQDIPSTLYESRFKELDGLEYFDLRIEKKEQNGDLLKLVSGDYSGYDALVKYYSFKVGDDISLMSNQDTIKCEFFHFERTYGSVPYLSFVIAFPKTNEIKNSTELVFVLNDRVFNKGLIKFSYSQQELTNIPKLKL